jgi:hypothetical protein
MNGVTIAKLSWNKTGEIELVVKMPFNYNKTERPYEPLLKIFLVKKKFLISIRGCFSLMKYLVLIFLYILTKKGNLLVWLGWPPFKL